MANFCNKCGSRLDKETDLCPQCDAKKIKKLQNQSKINENFDYDSQLDERIKPMKKKNFIILNIVTLVLCLAIMGIGTFFLPRAIETFFLSKGGTGGESSAETYLSISQYNYTLEVGESVKIDLSTTENITFSSADSSIAMVDSYGNIYGVTTGQTSIIVSDNTYSKDYIVSVTITQSTSNDNDNTSDYTVDSSIDSSDVQASGSEYILENSSTTLLTASDVENLTKEQLRLARNEIYARHGCYFEDSEIQSYFESCSWYNNLGYKALEFNNLSDIEKKNIDLIKSYES